MTEQKPSEAKYEDWLRDSLGVEIPAHYETYYGTVAETMRSDFELSPVWEELPATLKLANYDYEASHGLPLLLTPDIKVDLDIKQYRNFFQKTYRKNILENKDWDRPPLGGWITPDNWLSRIADIVRTTIVVKYFDGVSFLVSRIQSLCEETGVLCKPTFKAKMDEGYYAAHIDIKSIIRIPGIPGISWDMEQVEFSVEVQVTTQVQEVLRSLLHRYYEEKRARPAEESQWQWDYNSNEFSANYLGHILHYLEGRILELRDRQKEGSE